MKMKNKISSHERHEEALQNVSNGYLLTTRQYGEFLDTTLHQNEEDLLSDLDTCSIMASIEIVSIFFKGQDVTSRYL